MEVSGQLHAPGTVLLWKAPYIPVQQKAGWAPEPISTFWRREHLFLLLGIEPQFKEQLYLKHWTNIPMMNRLICEGRAHGAIDGNIYVLSPD
jgi:hypothetical protein